MNKSLTEAQVLNKLDIPDFRHMSKDKIMNFVSILPEVGSEVAIKIIEQFPDFTNSAVAMIDKMRELCVKALDDDKELTIKSIESYKQILDDLSIMLTKEDIDADERKYITEKMIEVADKIGLKVTEGKDFKSQVLKTIGGIIIGALALGGAILGAKYIDDNI